MEILIEWAQVLMAMVRTHDYLAMYLVLTLEEGGLPLPLPGDTIVAYAGYLTSIGRLLWWLVLVIAIASSVTGSLPLYWLARSKGRPALLHYGKFLHLTPARSNRIEGWLQRHGGPAVFVGRIFPGLRVGTTAIAGVFEVPFWSFLTYLTLSAIVWWGFWLWLGAAVGKRIAPLLEISPVHFLLAVGSVVVIATVFLYVRHQERKAGQKEPATVPAVTDGGSTTSTTQQSDYPASPNPAEPSPTPLLSRPTAVED